ncbi:dihydrodipicolinate synthase family protein [Hamadaea tsunoensis]|uniref:dihydrodipicolinate synthase family protein n=1 Tax=Hamadaea tsunoensis TaxID=53368 RepID=UPI0003F57BFF|nr:dihydrodipicolinate synthase family protein [Hamadaea tsunoensis]
MDLTGVFVPLITPFDAHGDVAVDALIRLAYETLEDGATGLVALGTTAEPGSLTPAEQDAVVDAIGRVCEERGAPMIVGAGRAAATRRPVAAALVMVPPFVRAGEAGVEAYFARLAADSAVPLIVYHIPYRTGQQLSPPALRRIAQLPNIAGIKYATGRVDADTLALLASAPTGFSVLAGDDVVLAPLLAMGAHGGILASAHLSTHRYARLVAAWRDGDVPTARELGLPLAHLSHMVFAEPNPTVVKGVLHAQGRIPTPDVRLPLLPAAPSNVDAVLALLD